MKDFRFLVSLVDEDNDYQRAQAAAAKEAARRLGVRVEVLFAGGDGVEQSQQLLKYIQSSTSSYRIDGVVMQPAGTGLPHVARAAAAAGIGWVVLHRNVDYVFDLRKNHNAPVFMVSSDHAEAGRIQGKQVGALLPNGGTVLCVTGPAADPISEQRLTGLQNTKPENVHVMTIRGKWTEQSGNDAVRSWLRLSTSLQQPIGVIVGQNDVMAIGAKKAFSDLPSGEQRDRLIKLPVIGCDGLPDSGQAWVRQGKLAATVILPVIAGIGVEMLAKALSGSVVPPEHTTVDPYPHPPIELLQG
jgi:ribose transport system substrate-binding protein